MVLRLALLLASLAGIAFAGCGDAPQCVLVQCLRSTACRTSCTAPVTPNGCCPCPAGTFDDVGICEADGGVRDAGP